MRIVSYNINGLKSAWEKHLKQYISTTQADVFCVQEIRTKKGLVLYFVPGYEEFYYPSDTPGYAGVGMFCKRTPKALIHGLGVPGRAAEGRAITIETKDLYVVNVYAPASGSNLERLDNKVSWLNDLSRYVQYLEGKKPVIICGDMNVAGGVIDMPYDMREVKTAGNTTEEREAFNRLINAGYFDVWRQFHPGVRGVSWAPYAYQKAREDEVGWRLDYFLVSESLRNRVRCCEILPGNEISDHRCVILDIK